jgi:hypothetical protein
VGTLLSGSRATTARLSAISQLNAFTSASRCYYWQHVHAGDGIIHIESPPQGTYIQLDVGTPTPAPVTVARSRARL